MLCTRMARSNESSRAQLHQQPASNVPSSFSSFYLQCICPLTVEQGRSLIILFYNVGIQEGSCRTLWVHQLPWQIADGRRRICGHGTNLLFHLLTHHEVMTLEDSSKTTVTIGLAKEFSTLHGGACGVSTAAVSTHFSLPSSGWQPAWPLFNGAIARW